MESEVEVEAEPQAEAPVSFGLQSRDVLPIVIVLAGVASGLSGQQPTGNVAADFVLSFLLGSAVVWLSRFASAQALVVSAVLGLFFTGMQMPAAFIGLAAVASAVFLTAWRRFDRESWLIGASVTAAFISQVALNLPSIRVVGSASILAAITLAPLVWTAVKDLPQPYRKRMYWGLGAVAIYTVVATILALWAVLGVRNQVEVGIEQAENGVTAVQAGDQPGAVALLDAAEINFNQASDRLGGPMTWPARFVPILAQHSRAIETASDQGAALARTASRVVTRADVEKIRGTNGAIDIDLVESVNVELTSANLVLRDAQQSLFDVRTAWLLPQLSSRLDTVQAELADTALDIDLANQATTVLPGILGANGSRQYLLLFVQPAESREYGGFVGAYGLLTAEGGRFDLIESGSIDTDFGFTTGSTPEIGDASFTEPGAFPLSYLQTGPSDNPQNLTAIADLSTIARAAADLAPQWRDNPDFAVDGIITIDPYALGGLLELTGPIFIQGRAEAIDSTNVVDFLLRDQYAEFEIFERDVRQDLLKVLAGQAFDRLLTLDVPGPERLGSVFGPLARGNRLSFHSFDAAENAFLDRVFLSADMPQVGPDIDMLGIYTATAAASKLDAYLTRETTYVVDVDPATGAVSGHVTIELTNDAPADANVYVLGEDTEGVSGVLPSGTNFLAVSAYAHEKATNITSDAPLRVIEVEPALGYERAWTAVEIPLGSTTTLEFDLVTTVAPGRYDLVVPASQAANPGDFTLVVRPAEGWSVVADDAAVDGGWNGTVSTDTGNAFSFTFTQAG